MKSPHLPSLLPALLTQPTAPFREDVVKNFVSHFLDKNKIPYFEDPVGNLVVGTSSRKAYQKLLAQKSTEPVRFFIAHLDHPGFHAKKWLDSRTLSFEWKGGSPGRLLKGASVWLADSKGYVDPQLGSAKIHSFQLVKNRYLKSGTLKLSTSRLREAYPRPSDLFGSFQFRKPVWTKGSFLYTKAADDLVGVYAILRLALKQFRSSSSKKVPLIGLLSRAEEVGFVGTLAHLDLGDLSKAQRPVLAVSLETSRTLPGAEFGKGPVVRLGDRSTLFDPACSKILKRLATKTLRTHWQSRIMDGGSCEGSATMAWGIPTIALSLPLGNYHNEGYEGGPDCRGPRGPAPEFVHLNDIQGLEKLLQALMKPRIPWLRPWEEDRSRLQKHLQKQRRLL